MKSKLSKHLLKAFVLIYAATLCSCAMPDPKYSANVSRISDIDYPRTKIVGTWADVYVKQIQTSDADAEGKVYYEIYSNGSGTVRQASRNPVTGRSMSIEATFKWHYLGKNKWSIILPPSTQYRVVESSGFEMGYRDSVTMFVRYYNGELYQTPTSHIWVQADSAHVSELSQRIHSNQPPLMYIDNQQ